MGKPFMDKCMSCKKEHEPGWHYCYVTKKSEGGSICGVCDHRYARGHPHPCTVSSKHIGAAVHDYAAIARGLKG